MSTQKPSLFDQFSAVQAQFSEFSSNSKTPITTSPSTTAPDLTSQQDTILHLLSEYSNHVDQLSEQEKKKQDVFSQIIQDPTSLSSNFPNSLPSAKSLGLHQFGSSINIHESTPSTHFTHFQSFFNQTRKQLQNNPNGPRILDAITKHYYAQYGINPTSSDERIGVIYNDLSSSTETPSPSLPQPNSLHPHPFPQPFGSRPDDSQASIDNQPTRVAYVQHNSVILNEDFELFGLQYRPTAHPAPLRSYSDPDRPKPHDGLLEQIGMDLVNPAHLVRDWEKSLHSQQHNQRQFELMQQQQSHGFGFDSNSQPRLPSTTPLNTIASHNAFSSTNTVKMDWYDKSTTFPFKVQVSPPTDPSAIKELPKLPSGGPKMLSDKEKAFLYKNKAKQDETRQYNSLQQFFSQFGQPLNQTPSPATVYQYQLYLQQLAHNELINDVKNASVRVLDNQSALKHAALPSKSSNSLQNNDADKSTSFLSLNDIETQQDDPSSTPPNNADHTMIDDSTDQSTQNAPTNTLLQPQYQQKTLDYSKYQKNINSFADAEKIKTSLQYSEEYALTQAQLSFLKVHSQMLDGYTKKFLSETAEKSDVRSRALRLKSLRGFTRDTKYPFLSAATGEGKDENGVVTVQFQTPKIDDNLNQLQHASLNQAYLRILSQYQSLYGLYLQDSDELQKMKSDYLMLINAYQSLQQQFHTASILNSRLLKQNPQVLNLAELRKLAKIEASEKRHQLLKSSPRQAGDSASNTEISSGMSEEETDQSSVSGPTSDSQSQLTLDQLQVLEVLLTDSLSAYSLTSQDQSNQEQPAGAVGTVVSQCDLRNPVQLTELVTQSDALLSKVDNDDLNLSQFDQAWRENKFKLDLLKDLEAQQNALLEQLHIDKTASSINAVQFRRRGAAQMPFSANPASTSTVGASFGSTTGNFMKGVNFGSISGGRGNFFSTTLDPYAQYAFDQETDFDNAMNMKHYNAIGDVADESNDFDSFGRVKRKLSTLIGSSNNTDLDSIDGVDSKGVDKRAVKKQRIIGGTVGSTVATSTNKSSSQSEKTMGDVDTATETSIVLETIVEGGLNSQVENTNTSTEVHIQAETDPSNDAGGQRGEDSENDDHNSNSNNKKRPNKPSRGSRK